MSSEDHFSHLQRGSATGDEQPSYLALCFQPGFNLCWNRNEAASVGGADTWVRHCDITKGSFTEVPLLLRMKEAEDVKGGFFWRVNWQDGDNDDWKNWKNEPLLFIISLTVLIY